MIEWTRVPGAVLTGAAVFALALGTAAAQGGLEWYDAMNAASKAIKESRYTEAEVWLRTAVKEAEKFEPTDQRLTVSLGTLGNILYKQGHYAEAGEVFKRTLAIAEKTLGPGHLRVADNLSGLAQIYQMQAKPAEAEPLLERALAIREKVLGPEHPDVASSLNSL